MRFGWQWPRMLLAGAGVAILVSAPQIGAQISPRAADTHGEPKKTANHSTVELTEAANLVRAARLAEAETATRKIIAANPRNAEAHSLLGVILDQRGRF